MTHETGYLWFCDRGHTVATVLAVMCAGLSLGEVCRRVE